MLKMVSGVEKINTIFFFFGFFFEDSGSDISTDYDPEVEPKPIPVSDPALQGLL